MNGECSVHIASILFTFCLPFHQIQFTYNLWTRAHTQTHTNRRNYMSICSSCCTRNYWILCTVFIEEMVWFGWAPKKPTEWENNNNNLNTARQICAKRTRAHSLNIFKLCGSESSVHITFHGRFEWNLNGKWESRAPTTYRKLRTVFRDLQTEVDVVQASGAYYACMCTISRNERNEEKKKTLRKKQSVCCTLL